MEDFDVRIFPLRVQSVGDISRAPQKNIPGIVKVPDELVLVEFQYLNTLFTTCFSAQVFLEYIKYYVHLHFHILLYQV